MILVKLREAMAEYRRKTGEKMTYEILAAKTGLAKSTLESLASRNSYNTRLNTIEKICLALNCSPGDLLFLTAEDTVALNDNSDEV